MTESPHKTIDPMTGNCLDCGATPEMVDDGLVPACRKFTGPHKLALAVLNRALMLRRAEVDAADRALRVAEEHVVIQTARLRQAKQDEGELAASVEFMAAAGAQATDKITAAEAVARQQNRFR